MLAIQIGSYVAYKGQACLVLASSNMVKLLNPVGLGSNKCVQVSKGNVKPMNYKPATIVFHNDNEYLVTKHGMIVSLKTCKIMKWSPTDGNRIAIVNAAAILN